MRSAQTACGGRRYLDGGVLVLGGHGSEGDLFVEVIPVGPHVPGRVHAQGTAVRPGPKT